MVNINFYECETRIVYLAPPQVNKALEMPVNVSCWCEKCNMQANNGLRTRMCACPQCGDKRCDRALNHTNNCNTDTKG